MIGHAEGLTDAQIAKLEADAPAIRQLIALVIEAKPFIEDAVLIFQEAQPIFNAAQPTFLKALALYQKAKPLLAQAWKEFQIAGPDIQMMIGLLAKSSASAGPKADQY